MTAITQAQVRELLDYNPDTGQIVWRVARGRCARGSPAGYESHRGYIGIRVNGRCYYLHRIACLYMTGEQPQAVDHINGRRADNRWENLRAAHGSVNAQNQKRPSSNKSGVIGVFWNASKGKWTAKIGVYNRDIHLGHFTSFDDAVRARATSEKAHGFHANHGRP